MHTRASLHKHMIPVNRVSHLAAFRPPDPITGHYTMNDGHNALHCDELMTGPAISPSIFPMTFGTVNDVTNAGALPGLKIVKI